MTSYASRPPARVLGVDPGLTRCGLGVVEGVPGRPPTLVATGANDEIFPEEVGRQILTDHPDAEYHALQTGHFALEDKAAEIAALMRDFLARTVPRA